MDKEAQPSVPSDLTVVPISGSSLDSDDTKVGNYMLPTVVEIANQVSVEMRQSHPQCFSRLPIVVIQRYEPDEPTSVKVTDSTVDNVLPNIPLEIKDAEDSQKQFKHNETVDYDELSVVSNEPSSILSNNDSTNCLKRPLLNESLDNEKTKKKKQNENFIEKQFKTSDLKINLHKEGLTNMSNEQSSNSILSNNDSTNYTKINQQNGLSDSDEIKKNAGNENNSNNNKSFSSKTLDDKDNNVDTDAYDISIEEQVSAIIDGDEKDSDLPEDVLVLKRTIQTLYSKSVNKNIKSCKNEFNVLKGEMKNKSDLIKIIDLDHHYYKSLSPENSDQEKIVNEVPQSTVKKMDIEHNDNNDLTDQTVESNCIDATNELPTSVAREDFQNTVLDDEDSEEVGSGELPDVFKLYDKQRWMELSDDLNKTEKHIFNKLLPVFERKDLTMQEMEQVASIKINEMMTERFENSFQRQNEILYQRKEEVWRRKYETLAHQLCELQAILKQHTEDLKTDKNAVPRKLRRHVKVQTKRIKNMVMEPKPQKPIIAMHFTVDGHSNVLGTSNSNEKCSKSTGKNTKTKALVTSTQTSSNYTPPLVSMSPTCSSNVIVNSTSTTSYSQTVLDSRNYNFSTNISNQHFKPVYVVSGGNYIPVKLTPVITTMAAPKENVDSGPRIKNVFSLQTTHLPKEMQYLRPVPPAIPIADDDIPTSITHKQKNYSSLKQLLQAPNKRSMNYGPSKAKSRKIDATISDTPIEVIDLLSPEPPDETEMNNTAPSSSIDNQNYRFVNTQPKSKLMPKITNVRTITDVDKFYSKLSEPIEIDSLSSSESSEVSELNDLDASSEITNQKHFLAKTQQSLKPIQLKETKTEKRMGFSYFNRNGVNDGQNNDTNLNPHMETISLLSPEYPEEFDINIPSTSTGITHQKYLYASTQQFLAPAYLKENSKVTEVTHENRTETRDESPIEMIDSSDPESSEESEINDPISISEITKQKNHSAENTQPSAPTQLQETSKVPDVTSQENQIESPNAIEMTNLSSLEPINNTEMNDTVTSIGITNQKYLLEKTEQSLDQAQLEETLKVAAMISQEPSNIAIAEHLNSSFLERLRKLKDSDLATFKQISLPSWKPIPTPTIKISEKQTSEELTLILGTETDNNAKIKRFQIFCQYDISEGPTNEDAWVQLGDVDFIPVPMACVLKKCSRNIKCRFAVRAVDIYNRLSPFISSETIFIN